MPELASIETRPPQGSCPSAEDLACYVDGTLSPEEAARVTAHLASCESCFEVYSEVLQFQLESEPPAGKVVPFPGEKRRPAVPWWSSIAAVLLVGVVGGYFYFLAPPPTLVTATLAAPIQGKAGIAKSFWRGEIHRGGPESEPKEGLSPDLAAFRTGVQMVNLQASLQADDINTVTGTVIPATLGALDGQIGTNEIQDNLKAVTSALLRGRAPKDLLPEASKLAKETREYLDPLYFDLGQWVEAGRLAAIARDPAFFQQPENRSFLRHVLWRDRLGIGDSKLPKASRQQLDAIYEILGKGTLQSADFVTLKDHFENILDANYPQS